MIFLNYYREDLNTLTPPLFHDSESKSSTHFDSLVHIPYVETTTLDNQPSTSRYTSGSSLVTESSRNGNSNKSCVVIELTSDDSIICPNHDGKYPSLQYLLYFCSRLP